MKKHPSHEGKNLPPGIYDRKVDVTGAMMNEAKGRALFEELTAKGGITACLNGNNGELLVLLTDSKAVHEVFQDNRKFPKGKLAIQSGAPVIGPFNIFTAPYEQWLPQRKATSSAQYESKMEDYWGKTWDGFGDVLDGWESMGTVNITEQSPIATFQVGGRLFFSEQFSHEQASIIPNAVKYLHPLQAKLPLNEKLGIAGPLVYYALFNVDAVKGDIAVGQKNHFVEAFIEEREAALSRGATFTDLMQIIFDSVNDPAMQKVIASGVVPPTFKRDQISTFSVGFGETTATTLAHWITLMQTREKDAKLVIEEVGDIIGMGRPTYEQTNQLIHFDRFVDEEWRLLPPAFRSFRTNEEWAEIGGYDIPPNSAIIISVYDLQRREDYYTNANEFLPERHDPESEYHVVVEGTADATFSSGPRICWGKKTAKQMTRASGIQFIQRYHLGGRKSVRFVRPPLLDRHGVPVPRFNLTLQPQKDLLLQFDSR